MIDALRGSVRIVELESGSIAVQTSGGVSYEVRVPARSIAALAETEPPVELSVHMHWSEREGPILYAFAHPLDRAVFRALLGLDKIGPDKALGILDALDREELATLVYDRRVDLLAKVRGVGKVTAQRLVEGLPEALRKLPLATKPCEVPPAAPAPSAPAPLAAHPDLVAALVKLGNTPADARRVAGEVSRDLAGATFEEHVRESIRRLHAPAKTTKG